MGTAWIRLYSGIEISIQLQVTIIYRWTSRQVSVQIKTMTLLGPGTKICMKRLDLMWPVLMKGLDIIKLVEANDQGPWLSCVQTEVRLNWKTWSFSIINENKYLKVIKLWLKEGCMTSFRTQDCQFHYFPDSFFSGLSLSRPSHWEFSGLFQIPSHLLHFPELRSIPTFPFESIHVSLCYSISPCLACHPLLDPPSVRSSAFTPPLPHRSSMSYLVFFIDSWIILLIISFFLPSPVFSSSIHLPSSSRLFSLVKLKHLLQRKGLWRRGFEAVLEEERWSVKQGIWNKYFLAKFWIQ